MLSHKLIFPCNSIQSAWKVGVLKMSRDFNPTYSGPNWNKMCNTYKITTEVLKITKISQICTNQTYFTLILSVMITFCLHMLLFGFYKIMESNRDMFYECLFTVPLQVHKITNYFKPFQTGIVLTSALLACTFLWAQRYNQLTSLPNVD